VFFYLLSNKFAISKLRDLRVVGCYVVEVKISEMSHELICKHDIHYF